MHSIPFVSLKATNSQIEGELIEATERVVASGLYINGPENTAFASLLSTRLDAGHVTPVSNGLDALRLIFRGYMECGRLKTGDEVIAPANTYIASILPLAELGLTTVLAEPSEETFGLDWKALEKSLTPRTKAVITVHLYGTPSWDFAAAALLRERGILIIEDNAQAIGAKITDTKSGREHFTGALGDAAAFSFYPTKNIGALGDAGAVATHDDELSRIVGSLKNYGSSVRYHNDFTGYNCRMDEIQAAVLNVKMKHLDEISEKRRATAAIYTENITNPLFLKPALIGDTYQVWHQYVVRTPRRDEAAAYLRELGIATDVHYPVPLHRQKCFTNLTEDCFRISEEAAALAERLSKEVLSLPIADVTAGQALQISEALNKF